MMKMGKKNAAVAECGNFKGKICLMNKENLKLWLLGSFLNNFSLFLKLKFFVVPKMKMSIIMNRPLCRYATDVILKLSFCVQ